MLLRTSMVTSARRRRFDQATRRPGHSPGKQADLGGARRGAPASLTQLRAACNLSSRQEKEKTMLDIATRKVNGLDLDALDETVAAINADAGRAAVQFRVRTEWAGQTRSESRVE